MRNLSFVYRHTVFGSGMMEDLLLKIAPTDGREVDSC